MLILGFDTATPVTAIGIAADGEILAQCSLGSDKTQTEELMPSVDAILKTAGVSKRDIQGLAVGLGPGLFTSSRIGVMTAKALAFALRIPVAGILTLDTIARGAAHLADNAVSVIDAKRKEVFVATYDTSGGGLKRTGRPEVMPPEGLAEVVSDMTGKVILAGNGISAYRERLRGLLGDTSELAPDTLSFPDAAHLLALAAERLEGGDSDPPERIEPVYIRHADAKIYKSKDRP